jgi:hypothetical protein
MGNSIPCRTAQEQPGGPILFLRGSTVLPPSLKRTSVLRRCDGALTMHAISDNAASQQSLAAPSIATYGAGETVLSAALTTGRLLILKEGVVTVVMEGVEIIKVTEPGAVFGELSAWPHTADVHVLEESKFHVASTAAPLMQDPVALPYVATVVECPEDSANCAQVELKRQVQDGQLSSITRKTIDEIEESLGASGGNLVYAGYPYDPFVLDTVKN